MPLITTFSLGDDNIPTKYDIGALLISDTNLNICVDPVEINVKLLTSNS